MRRKEGDEVVMGAEKGATAGGHFMAPGEKVLSPINRNVPRQKAWLKVVVNGCFLLETRDSFILFLSSDNDAHYKKRTKRHESYDG